MDVGCTWHLNLCRCGFFEKTSCVQFSVCASLHDMDYLRKVETEPTKLLMLDSDHKIWCWKPTKRGSVPYIMPGLSKLNGMYFVYLSWSFRLAWLMQMYFSDPVLSRQEPDCCDPMGWSLQWAGFCGKTPCAIPATWHPECPCCIHWL